MMKMTMMILSSQMLMYKTHMYILVSIISMCLLMSYIWFSLSMNYWLMLVIVMVYISGIMVLFMFIISLSPNEKMMMKKKNNLYVMTFISAILLMKSKTTMKSEFKLNSCYKMNMMFLIIMLVLILMSAYAPPKMMMMIYKGMKSSK